MTRADPPGIASRAVGAWLQTHVPDVQGPFHFSLIAGGNSNLTFRVDDAGGRALALRRPPLGRILESAHDMTREFRVIAALRGTPVPVPSALALCTDPHVNDMDFYVMEFVDGLVPHDAEVSAAIPPGDRADLSRDVIDVLAALHAVDPDEVGLGNLGRREEYVARQLRRWSRQWEESKQRDVPAMEELRRRLESGVPAQLRTTVVHGDYRMGNMIVGDGRVRALLDWELCTLGDPMADLGYLLNNWLAPDEPVVWRSTATQAGGFLDRDTLIDRYATTTGADVSQVGYFQAFQGWRLAAILEGVYARYLHGAMGSVDGVDLDAMAESVIALAESALDRIT